MVANSLFQCFNQHFQIRHKVFGVFDQKSDGSYDLSSQFFTFLVSRSQRVFYDGDNHSEGRNINEMYEFSFE